MPSALPFRGHNIKNGVPPFSGGTRPVSANIVNFLSNSEYRRSFSIDSQSSRLLGSRSATFSPQNVAEDLLLALLGNDIAPKRRPGSASPITTAALSPHNAPLVRIFAFDKSNITRFQSRHRAIYVKATNCKRTDLKRFPKGK